MSMKPKDFKLLAKCLGLMFKDLRRNDSAYEPIGSGQAEDIILKHLIAFCYEENIKFDKDKFQTALEGEYNG